ncbi:MAG TPA: type I polyketide synthase [Anaerolineae bacterium]|nr:type I polyketide synthase [Anaerolineae bacterium]
MSEFLDRISGMSPKRLALLAMELQEKVEALEAAAQPITAPIAVIGIGCRMPGGADSPEAFWQLLRNGVDAVTEVDNTRWDVDAYFDPDPNRPGKIASRWGGFLRDVDQFDPQFFGIAPREAMSMDPQQRLALEVCWEALEHAGYAPDRLSGSATGVFMGICNGDYYQMQVASNRDGVNMYTATGSAHSVVSGRIAYVIGLRGPAVSVDTACSSSAVAIHLAVQSLRNGECRMALAGGVNLILSPDTTIALSRAGMMAPDGRCKAFDSAADGFVRSEGCSIVVLKRLPDALADGDHVLAVIRGSALNQDGRSNGLTAPNGPSQVAVIRSALANAGVQPEDVSYVETHGTGTSLGDPIEAQALGAALGKNRSAPLMIGSVKTNVGHTESTAGVAGVIKTVLALYHKEIPPHLHLKHLSEHIPWDELPITIPTALTPWEPTNGKRIAGASSFGFSGTNAHFIIEEAPAQSPVTNPSERPLHLLTLSARDESALRKLAHRYASRLANHPTIQLPNVCFTTNAGRSHFNQRLALVVKDAAAAQAGLAEIAAGQTPESALLGQAPTNRRPEVVFMFTGHGAQYLDMGRRLYETQPTFRAAIDRCDALLRPHLSQSLTSILYPEQSAISNPTPLRSGDYSQQSAIDDMALAQPALFAIEYALAELWQAWGVRPSAVMGHSAGEYVAACVAGIFSLEDGLKLIAERARLMASLPPTGEMAAVFASEARVAEALAPFAERVSIAAVNWPESVTISGEKVAVQSVLDALRQDGIRSRRLAIPTASHSPLMEPILDAFEQTAATVSYAPPQIDFVSGMSGQLVGASEATNTGYWRRHLRQAVRFADSIETLHQKGYELFVEIGPTPTLIGMAQRCVSGGVWVPSLRSGHDDWQTILTSLGTLYTHGVDIDWAGFDRDYARRRVPLPTYPFQRQRYWFETGSDTPAATQKPMSRVRDSSAAHQAVHGQRLHSPLLPPDAVVFETQFGATWPPFLDHHRIFGTVILPSPAYIEMVLAGAAEAFGGAYAIDDLMIHEALILPEDGVRTVQLILDKADAGYSEFKVYGRDDEAGTWTLHATGKAQLEPATPPTDAVLVLDDVRSRCSDEIDGEAYYERVRGLGLEFGSAFRGLRQIWRREGEALGLIQLPAELTAEADSYRFHPAFLDACFHLLGAPLPDEDDQSAYLLIGLDRFVSYARPGERVWNHTVMHGIDSGKETFSCDLRLFGEDGALIAEAQGLHLKRATRGALERLTRRHSHPDWFYEVQWQASQSHLPMLRSDPQHIAAQTRQRFDVASAQHDLSVYQELLPALDALTAAYVRQALRQLGWSPVIGDRVSTEALAVQLGIVTGQRRLFARLLGILAEDGVLKSNAGEWEVVAPLAEDDPQAQHAALVERFGSICEAEVTLTGRCGAALAEVLSGRADPLQLLFPNGSLALTEKLYQESPFARVYNGLVRETIAAIAAWPEDRPLRVLEIGAGTGATTSFLLPILPPDRTEYVFTDVTPMFTARAAEKFRAYNFVRYQVFDVERSPAEQGLSAGHFDIVVAANVLHATVDLRQSLVHARQLLAPDGLLILLEGAERSRWVDITFGLTEGWWRFGDTDLRPDYPLLTSERWLNLLPSVGLVDPVALPGDEAKLPAYQTLLLARAAAEKHDWLILADRGGVAAQLAESIAERGEGCRVIAPGAAYDEALAAASQVIDLRALDVPAESDPAALCADALQLAQAIIERGATHTQLWLVTRHAQPTNHPTIQPSNPAALQLSASPLWGLGRVIALEQPEMWGGLIDLDIDSTPDRDAATLIAEVTQPDGEDQIAWRGSQRYVARLARSRAATLKPAIIRSDAAYLITGGLGGLGLKIAHRLAERGVGHIVLIGRSGLPGDSDPRLATIQSIEAAGAHVTVVAVDVTDRAAMATLIARFGRDLPPLRGIVHAAVAMTGWPIRSMPLDGLRAMLGPKVVGTRWLDELTRDVPLDFFVLFSSTTALWGSRNLGHYAAANTFLDAFAHVQRASGRRTLAINWGIWDEMRVASEADQQSFKQFGLNPMPSDEALEIMDNLLGSDLAQIAVAAVDWGILKPAYEARRARPFLALIDAPQRAAESKSAKTADAKPTRPELLRQIESARAADRRAVVVAHVRAQVAKVLGLDAARIDDQQGLFEMGMDSLMSVELKSRLEAGVGQSLPSTLTFNYASVGALTDYLLSRFAPQATAPAAEPVASMAAPGNGAAVAEHDDLSEDELAEQLMKRLGQLN